MMEWKRVINIKFAGLLLLFAAVNCGFFYRTQMVEGDSEIYETASVWDSEYSIFDVYKQYEKNLSHEDVKSTYVPRGKVSETDYVFYKKAYDMALTQDEYVRNYPVYIESIIDNAELKLGIEIYAKPGSYSRGNLLKTRYDFLTLKDISVKNGNYEAYTSASKYTATNIFILIMLTILVLRFFDERKNGLFAVIRSTLNGRLRLTIKRLLILTGTGILVTAFLEVSVYLVSVYLYGGFSVIGAPVQSTKEFAQCMFQVSFLEFIGLTILVKSIAMISMALVVWLVVDIFSSRQIMILVLFIIIGIELLLNQVIPNQSSFAVLKYFNIIALFDITNVFMNYENVGIGAYILTKKEVILGFSITIGVFIAAVLSIRTIVCKNLKSENRAAVAVNDFFAKYCGKIFSELPLFFKELYKIMFTQRGVLVVIFAVFLLFQGMVSVGVTYNETEAVLNVYYGKVKAAEDQEIFTDQYIEELRVWIQGLEEKFQQSEDSGEVFSEQQLSREIEIQKKALAAIEEEQAYRKEQKEISGREYGVINQMEYRTFTGQRMDSYEEYNAFLALTALIIICFGVFSYEKKNNMIELITASRIGMKKNSLIKILSATACVVLIAGLIYGISFYNSMSVYEISASEFRYSVQSIISLSEYPFSISITGYLILLHLKRLLVMFLVMGWTLYVSSKLDYNRCIYCSLLILVPYVLSFFGLHFFQAVSIVHWMI